MAATDLVNTRWVLAQRPGQRAFDADQDCRKETAPVPALAPDEVCVKVELLSVDAFIRTMLDAEAYHGAIQLGDRCPRATAPSSPRATTRRSTGKRVLGMCKAQTHAVGTMGMEGFMPCMGFRASRRRRAWLLSVATGVASYVGCFKLLKTTARGSSARRRVKKCAFVTERLGADAAVDYKSPTFAADLDAACPDGVDFFLDNAGGDTLRVALDRINMRSRVVVCGAASQYSGNLNTGRDDKGQGGAVVGPSSYLKLSEKSSTMAGFAMHYFVHPLALFNLCWYHWRGKVVVHEQIEEGLDAWARPAARRGRGDAEARESAEAPPPEPKAAARKPTAKSSGAGDATAATRRRLAPRWNAFVTAPSDGAAWNDAASLPATAVSTPATT
ncbi:prostaglandin reductase [Aureococcus anophagefferens]|nr:prostaglandin reductase [Aureococcus anophagefferens]